MPYLSVTHVENKVQQAAGGPNASFTQLITLPNQTWEQRTSHALKIAGGATPASERIGVYVIGGVHAREWGSPDILVNLIDDLTQAYQQGNGLTYGAKAFTAAQVQSIVERLNVYVFPQVNPDGRQHSMDPNGYGMWRKNRRPDPTCMGVDINRNYDFLWNYPTYFHPNAPVASSTNKCDEVYIGPSAESEPETKNVVWLADQNPEIRFFVDVHSYGKLLLYGWGDDQPQSTDPSMNFQNAAYDGQRGVANDAYREYITAPDDSLEIVLTQRMNAAIVAAGGPSYTVQTSYGLYPTSGSSCERMLARNFIDKAKGKIHGWTVEWGEEFQPPYQTMATIIEHITAALLELFVGIVETHSDVYIKDNASDTGTVPSTGVFWESPEIVIRNADDNVFTHQNPVQGQDNYLYVRVTNRGPAVSRELNVSARAVAFAGSEFVYPHDWTASDATHIAPAPVVDTFNALPVNGTAVAKFRLDAAQVAQLGNWQANNWHPCLLADVDCASDYGSPAGTHVWEGNNLAQRNITVVTASVGQVLSWAFLFGHALDAADLVKLRIDRSELPARAVLTLDLLDEKPRFPHVIDLVGGRGRTGRRVPVPRTREGLRGLLRTVPSNVAVIDDDRDGPQLRIPEGITNLELVRRPKEMSQALVRVAVPDDAKTGDVYRVRVAQQRGDGQVVGGVTLEVHVQ